MLIAPVRLFCRLHWIMLIMEGRGRAGEIIDLVYFHIEGVGNVMPDDFEVLTVEQMFDIATRTGECTRALNSGQTSSATLAASIAHAMRQAALASGTWEAHLNRFL
jgi:hypothetical protein